MYIALKNGRFCVFGDANQWELTDNELIVMGPRKRVIAHFQLNALAGWWFASEDVMTYGVTDQIERL